MTYKLLSFTDAVAKSEGHKRRLLLGNGFSIAWKPDVFKYDSLYEQADFSKLGNYIPAIFKAFKTTDFEIIMRHLRAAVEILKIYKPHDIDTIEKLTMDATSLKNVLVNAIAENHPENPSEITEEEYEYCKLFLNHFECFYTLNYDLLLYWTVMHFQETKDIKADDGFRTPDSGKAEYVSWELENTNKQNLFYLHGALHLFDAGSELKKYTWINTGIKLIEQIRTALDANIFPVFVSESSSSEKKTKIIHSNYLSRGLRSFANIGGCLFIYGHSLADNDDHILKLIHKGKLEQLFISIYGELTTDYNKQIVQKAEFIKSMRKSKTPLQIYFYDAESAHVWR